MVDSPSLLSSPCCWSQSSTPSLCWISVEIALGMPWQTPSFAEIVRIVEKETYRFNSGPGHHRLILERVSWQEALLVVGRGVGFEGRGISLPSQFALKGFGCDIGVPLKKFEQGILDLVWNPVL